MKTYYIETYGCVANKVDSDIIRGALESAGYIQTESPENADVVLINTCAVKTKTEEHMISRIKSLKRYGNLIVLGCLVDANPERIRKLGIEYMFGPKRYKELGKLLGVSIPEEKAGVVKRRDSTTTTSVYIEEGCLSACTFCATKFARGRTVSYSPDRIIKEIEEAVKGGAVEVRLTGQDTGTYGVDRGMSLVELISKILDRVEGEYRIRIGMMSPEHAIRLIDEGYLDLFKDERLYRFFHLPVQSGNNRILRLMGRKYTVEEFKELVNKIRASYPDALIETDVIVGFPTETWDEFMDTVNLIRELEIDVVNISRFSPRVGTAAASFKGQIPSNEKKKRSKVITEVHEEVSLRRYMRYLGKTVDVVVTERTEKGSYRARLNNYKLVIIEEGVREGEFTKVNIKEVTPRYLVGEPL